MSPGKLFVRMETPTFNQLADVRFHLAIMRGTFGVSEMFVQNVSGRF